MIRTHILPCTLPKAAADALNRASAAIYSHVLVTHYRVYRKKGNKTRHWLSPRAAERLNDYLTRTDAPLLHAHSKDAAQQGFYKACRTAHVNRRAGAHYPHRRKYWRTTIWKATGIRRSGETLVLARARGLAPIRVPIPAPLRAMLTFREVRLVWDKAARRYTWHVVVENGKQPKPPPGTNTLAVDLGEVHPAACTDGQATIIITARVLRHHKQYTAKRSAALAQQQAAKQRSSRAWKRLQRRKNRFLARQRRKVRDSEHKISRAVVQVALERQAGTIALGDVRDAADKVALGKRTNQKASGWTHGRLRQQISYKAAAEGIDVVLVNEAYTSQTCPGCGRRHKPRGRVYRCPACGFQSHRDAVGAANILSRYRFGDVGKIVPPAEIKHRRPAAISKRSMRSPLDTGHVACGSNPQEAAGL